MSLFSRSITFVRPGSLVLILSPSQRQSEELLKKIVSFYHELGRPGGSRGDSATTLQLRNKSRIVALPGSESTTRGYSPSLVLIDEAARVSEELYKTARPMLAVSRGRLILLSTPYGKRGIFWQAWNQESDWKWVKVTADQCPRISHEFLKQERRATAEWYFAQEYCCEFMQDDAAVFKEGWILYYDPHQPPMDTIIQSWDTAQTKSATSDYVVGQVWGRKGADLYLLDQVRYPDYPELIAELDVFKSDFTYGGAPNYSLQVAQQSGIFALCLVTYDVDPEAFSMPFDDIYYSYDPDLLRYWYGVTDVIH